MNNLSNQVQLIGRLGKDPELRTFDNGRALCSFSLATNEYYKNREGEKVQNTDWHNIVAWGKRAEFMAQLLKKGANVAIGGKLTNRSYEAKDGSTKFITEIVVNDFMLLDKKGEENA